MIINPVKINTVKAITKSSFENRLNHTINDTNDEILTIAKKGMNKVTVLNDRHILKIIQRIYKKAGFKTCLFKDDPYERDYLLKIMW